MTQHFAHAPTLDERLVAYLDGELDQEQRAQIEQLLRAEPGVAARLETLQSGDLPFKPAFDALLDQAPTARLHAMLDTLPPVQAPSLNRRRFLAIAAGFALAGVVADRLWMSGFHGGAGQGWRASVAEYMALYTPQTLENLDTNPASHAAQLGSVGAQLGLQLSLQAVSLPGAALRRAQILDYDGVPIGQLTYLDPRHGPLALCIIPSRKGPAAPATEQRHGMNVVYWASAFHAFMLIGRNPFEDLQRMARGVERALPV